MNSVRACLFLVISIIAFNTLASIEIYEFESDEDERRYQSLITELRCPKCQNQNLSGSNAEIAKDLKKRVYKLISQGKSDTEIVDYLVERYGDFVTYRPPVKPSTWLLWFGPFILFSFVGIFLLWRTRRVNKEASNKPDVDREKLQQILSSYPGETKRTDDK
ncbi:MAG: cytochrome c-type biogenesis protein CcmH [Pseudomonadales bacterium]|nr:cytochrome c-type biogenesis protein CcmH [Pseudomonadales bacterium]